MTLHPAGRPVPEGTQTDRLLLRPLRATDVELDYDAVMSSAAMLRAWSQSTWPADDFTLAQNLDDLVRHEREHEARVAFTYTVLDPAAARCLGCVYFTPVADGARSLCAGAMHPANVAFWVRASEVAADLDRHLLAHLREWLAAEWKFDRVLFTIAEHDMRQAALLVDAGLKRRALITLPDGRRCAAFV